MRFADDLLAIEMTIVTPPFILDFAGAYLDPAPEFSAEVWTQWTSEKQEQFGSEWERIVRLLGELKRLAIHVLDPTPTNFRSR